MELLFLILICYYYKSLKKSSSSSEALAVVAAVFAKLSSNSKSSDDGFASCLGLEKEEEALPVKKFEISVILACCSSVNFFGANSSKSCSRSNKKSLILL